MAKKKGINKLYLVGGAGGTVAAVLVAVFVFGVGLDVLPVVEASDVVPTPLTVEEQQENEQIIFDIGEITNDPNSFCPSNINALADCIIQTQGESTVPIAPEVDPATFVACGITEETTNLCNAEIEQIIADLNSQLNDPPPIPPPDSSPVEPIGQICDLLELDCGPKPPIQLETIVLKTDSTGFSDTVASTIDVPQLSFFIEDVVNGTRDFQTGQLDMIITIIGEPNTLYIASGNLNVIIGTEIVNEIPLRFEIGAGGVGSGTLSGNEGQLFVQFVGPTGIASPSFLFQFMPNFDKFLNGQTTLLDFVITDLIVDFVHPETGVKFGIVDTSIFSMAIARDDIKLLVIDEQGQTIRVYPSDSRIVLSTVTGRSDSYTTGLLRQVVFSSTFYGNGLGCSQPFVSSDRTFTPSTTNSGVTVPPPSISGISVLDSQSNTITTGTSGSGTVLDYNLLTRNQNYTLVVSSLGIVSSDLEYGQTTETKSYTCSQEATVNTSTSTTTSGNCAVACGSCTQSTSQIFGSLSLGEISCNIPEVVP